jgi:hypothetical protein
VRKEESVIDDSKKKDQKEQREKKKGTGRNKADRPWDKRIVKQRGKDDEHDKENHEANDRTASKQPN